MHVIGIPVAARWDEDIRRVIVTVALDKTSTRVDIALTEDAQPGREEFPPMWRRQVAKTGVYGWPLVVDRDQDTCVFVEWLDLSHDPDFKRSMDAA